MAIYEVHLGSWKKGFRDENDEDGFLNYRQLADQLAEYVTYMGYTHVELMGICEYPFDLSWGYQVTGYFAPTSRYGVPDDFRYLVDKLHQCGIGVILDWVPAHYPKDEFALSFFDGTPLYESPDPLRAEYPEWGTMAFDFAKPEVRSFLISSAFYWIREFHIDALRVDAVAAMIYNSYSRSEWRPNMYGGNQNLEAMDFMRQLNAAVLDLTPGYLIAEDSSAEWGVTSKDLGIQLGFTLKWNMGWMNDTLRYIELDPIYRQHHHELLVHTIDYAFSENYVLVLSHDEVVYGKKSLVEKSPGGVRSQLFMCENLSRRPGTVFLSVHHPLFLSSGRYFDLFCSCDQILVAGQFPEPHRTSCMQHLCTDTDFRAETELKSVGKPGGGIHVDTRAVNFF